MKKEYIIELFDEAGILHENGKKGYLKMSCPFAKYSNLHIHDTDVKKSGYIRVSDEGLSYFGCWTCEFSGNMWKLFKELKRLSGSSKYDDIIKKIFSKENKIINDETIYNINATPSNVFSKLKSRIEYIRHPIIDLYSLMYSVISEDKFSLDMAEITDKYLVSRGYTHEEAKKTCDNFNFRIGNNNNTGAYIARDFKKNIIGYMLFHMGKRTKDTKKYIVEYTAEKFLINEEVFYKKKFNSIDIVVSEGLFDVTRLSLHPSFNNVVGLQGKIKLQQMKKILYFSRKIFFFTDLDPVGIENVKKLGEFYNQNKELYGYRIIKVFDGFNYGDDPDSFFQGDNIITKYDFKDKFINWSEFVEKHKAMTERTDGEKNVSKSK